MFENTCFFLNLELMIKGKKRPFSRHTALLRPGGPYLKETIKPQRMPSKNVGNKTLYFSNSSYNAPSDALTVADTWLLSFQRHRQCGSDQRWPTSCVSIPSTRPASNYMRATPGVSACAGDMSAAAIAWSTTYTELCAARVGNSTRNRHPMT